MKEELDERAVNALERIADILDSIDDTLSRGLIHEWRDKHGEFQLSGVADMIDNVVEAMS